ncbi:fungal-specific transcription factor domain-containing protein [Mycena amicta]|nr:fungal-specific transcription factor domain-containing protein [Mycena amicta]
MDGSSASFAFQAGYEHSSQPEDDPETKSLAKGPKRKRLAKACSACHKSKRRCDGNLRSPCSNCFFSSKPCQYVDASGRPVAAPKPDASTPSRNIPSRSNVYPDDQDSSRKRVKSNSRQETAPLVLDHALTRELTNLFFTHCHPARAVFHKPSFSAALAHNRVPSYLLYTICALAAPLSRQPRFRSTGPPRLSGRPFAQEAISQMFDGSGHLICDASLFTAQALCLLMSASKDATARYRDLALQIVQAMGIYNPEPAAGSALSPDLIQASIERECGRRIFWVIHAMELACSIYTQRQVSLSENQLRLRLPVDETSFELAVHYPSPEHLYPSVRAQSTSELGHFIRILSLYTQTEHLLNRPDTDLNNYTDLEKRGEVCVEWLANLPENLRFSEPNLEVQQSMFETSSNTGAWCFCCMHVCYVGFVLALHAGRSILLSQSMKPPSSPQPQWTTSRLELIMQMLGDRAKKSMLMGAIIWIQIKYCNRDDAQIRGWCDEYEEVCGLRISDRVAPLVLHRTESAYPRLIPLTTASQMFPLGRSLDELRLHNHSNSWSGPPPVFATLDKEELSRRLKNDVDADLPPRSGRLGESLPSLKSSGLLDSWNSGAHRSTKTSSLEADRTNMPVGLQWLAHESR